jgi:hypothetical protein
MQGDSQVLRDMDEFAAHLDVIARAGLCAEIGTDPAIDRNATVHDQLITFAARSDSRRCQKSVEPHAEVELFRS